MPSESNEQKNDESTALKDESCHNNSLDEINYVDRLLRDFDTLVEGVEASAGWCKNTGNIFKLEFGIAWKTLPELVVAHFTLVILQILTWALLVATIIYAVYSVTGMLGLGFALAILVQAMGTFAYMVHIERLNRRMSFRHTRQQLNEMKQAVSAAETS